MAFLFCSGEKRPAEGEELLEKPVKKKKHKKKLDS